MYTFTVTVTIAAGGSSSVLHDIRGKLLAAYNSYASVACNAQRGIPSNAAASTCSSSTLPNFRRVRF